MNILLEIQARVPHRMARLIAVTLGVPATYRWWGDGWDAILPDRPVSLSFPSRPPATWNLRHLRHPSTASTSVHPGPERVLSPGQPHLMRLTLPPFRPLESALQSPEGSGSWTSSEIAASAPRPGCEVCGRRSSPTSKARTPGAEQTLCNSIPSRSPSPTGPGRLPPHARPPPTTPNRQTSASNVLRFSFPRGPQPATPHSTGPRQSTIARHLTLTVARSPLVRASSVPDPPA